MPPKEKKSEGVRAKGKAAAKAETKVKKAATKITKGKCRISRRKLRYTVLYKVCTLTEWHTECVWALKLLKASTH